MSNCLRKGKCLTSHGATIGAPRNSSLEIGEAGRGLVQFGMSLGPKVGHDFLHPVSGSTAGNTYDFRLGMLAIETVYLHQVLQCQTYRLSPAH